MSHCCDRLVILMVSLVLINGPSGCGKTSLAHGILKGINEEPTAEKSSLSSYTSIRTSVNRKAKIFHQDRYFTKPFLPYVKRTDDSYEDDSGINWDKLIKDIVDACRHAKKEEKGSRKNNGISLGHEESLLKRSVEWIFIVEGHMLSYTKTSKVFDSFDNIMFVEMNASKEICKNRRLNRNPNRSEEERKELSHYYDKFVWSSYLNYGRGAIESFQKLQLNDERSGGKQSKSFDSSKRYISHLAAIQKIQKETEGSLRISYSSERIFMIELANSGHFQDFRKQCIEPVILLL